MTDRELLELAAKAAGYELDLTVRPDGLHFYHSDRNAFALADGGWFAPLTCDGDALRLAVKLEIAVRYFDGEANAFGRDLEDHYEYGNDPYAATRRAIVRAAAEIGKDMK